LTLKKERTTDERTGRCGGDRIATCIGRPEFVVTPGGTTVACPLLAQGDAAYCVGSFYQLGRG
jgi:hypothetical protein